MLLILRRVRVVGRGDLVVVVDVGETRAPQRASRSSRPKLTRALIELAAGLPPHAGLRQNPTALTRRARQPPANTKVCPSSRTRPMVTPPGSPTRRHASSTTRRPRYSTATTPSAAQTPKRRNAETPKRRNSESRPSSPRSYLRPGFVGPGCRVLAETRQRPRGRHLLCKPVVASLCVPGGETNWGLRDVESRWLTDPVPNANQVFGTVQPPRAPNPICSRFRPSLGYPSADFTLPIGRTMRVTRNC
jgi:hypothetical protein